jgi:hypothetical protein
MYNLDFNKDRKIEYDDLINSLRVFNNCDLF